MKRKNLDDILHSVRTGRAISPAGVRKAAVALMETMIPRMVDSDYEGREFWTITLFGFAKPVRERRNYWDAVGGMEKQAVLHEDMSGELFWMLASLHQWGSESVKRWMSLSVEDVMREAGLVSLYEEWFQKEAVMWETEYGKAPSVGDIMKIAWELDWYEERKVQPYMEWSEDLFPENLTEPFRRTWRELGLKPLTLESAVEEAKHKYICLNCTWIWLLMVEAPGRIYCNSPECDSSSGC